ncbi:uncharacterized protein (DUF1778 family) [Advenella incenata]|uniref:Uncharacterized protein (DUF1778 family) n=1 Tax=Advenella incenata TaxID=267800 RepID=A0A4V2FRU2_9BURK|nr:DUF1778 domain-containing protein [Advenella incenata]RZT91729.1 uncharacterized protein (DUF1778 family) [Advenella incenata]
MSKSKSARLQLQIESDLYERIKYAAALQGSPISEFVVRAVKDAARKAIEETKIVHLSKEQQEFFARALMNPPELSPALKKVLARHKKFIVDR